jgi:hypothetical protein
MYSLPIPFAEITDQTIIFVGCLTVCTTQSILNSSLIRRLTYCALSHNISKWDSSLKQTLNKKKWALEFFF